MTLKYSSDMAKTRVDQETTEEAVAFLKTLANEHRLFILCQLAEGEKSVTELENLLGIRQPNLSQQLARLRSEKLVKTRREAKQVYYALDSVEARIMIDVLYELFCAVKVGELPLGSVPETVEAR